MKATVFALAVVFGVLAAAPHVQAQYNCPTIPQAPDTRGWYYYQQNHYGQWYGPNYCVYPPNPPFQGMVFAPSRPCPPGMPGYGQGQGAGYGNGMGGTVAFPSHQWARSPRDFFMYE